jgi:predicted small metal-binding protein
MARKIMDCRRVPSEKGCTLTIAGEEDEVLRAAVMHAVDAHGHRDTPEFREQLRGALEPERAAR